MKIQNENMSMFNLSPYESFKTKPTTLIKSKKLIKKILKKKKSRD